MQTIILDVGIPDSIRKDQPIVSADGLVGRIINVSEHVSIGQILMDRNFRAGARVQRSRVEGIIKWAGGNRCALSEVHKRADVHLGDVVVTSRTSTLFPPGLRIGSVVEIDSQSSNLYQTIFVKPFVDFSKLEEVFVIRTAPSLAETN